MTDGPLPAQINVALVIAEKRGPSIKLMLSVQQHEPLWTLLNRHEAQQLVQHLQNLISQMPHPTLILPSNFH